MHFLEHYFNKAPRELYSSEAIAYLGALDSIAKGHPSIAEAIVKELKDQRSQLKLIASENFSSLRVQLAMGNLLTDKYSEGIPFHRFYAGCENVDAIEQLAVDELKSIFGAEHAYVQPHSGADANMIAIWAVLVHRIQKKEVRRLGKKKLEELSSEEYEGVRQLLVNQKLMGMSLNSGGHLTHGYIHNNSAKIMRSVPYEVDRDTGLIDYKALGEQVLREKPLILIAGYSAYPRLIDFSKMREIADSVGAVLMADMAHFAGLVAGKALKGNYDPIPFSDIVTSTTHKTLRGPRGGFILCKKEYEEAINRGCPLVIGGPIPQIIAAKGVAFREANTTEFRHYSEQILKNAKALAEAFLSNGISLSTGGTDNHLLIVKVTDRFKLTGKQAEMVLRKGKLICNRNAIPFDPKGPWHTSGIRIGTAALTTLGMKETQMNRIAKWIIELLDATRSSEQMSGEIESDPTVLKRVQREVEELLSCFPLYPELIID